VLNVSDIIFLRMAPLALPSSSGLIWMPTALKATFDMNTNSNGLFTQLSGLQCYCRFFSLRQGKLCAVALTQMFSFFAVSQCIHI